MPGEIRWGILSTARISHAFARDFAHVGNGRLHAVASRSADRAAEFARRYGIPRSYGDYAGLLADPDVDAVYVSTPHTLHLQNSLAALAAGKAVLCEKPLTVNPEEARELTAAAGAAGVYLMEAMWTWFLPAVRTARRWFGEGRIGRLLHVRADFGYPIRPYDPGRREYDAALGGGCLLDMGIYPVALAWLFTRRDPERVQVSARFAPNGVEDDVVMNFDYGDCVAALAASFRCRLRNSAHIVGEEGYIVIPDFFRARECSLYRLDERVERFRDERESDGLCFETEAVGEDLLAGRLQSETVTWGDSIKFQEHMAAVREAFRRT